MMQPAAAAPANSSIASMPSPVHQEAAVSYPDTVHLYRRFGHVLCRQGSVRERVVSTEPKYVNCSKCLRMLQQLRLEAA